MNLNREQIPAEAGSSDSFSPPLLRDPNLHIVFGITLMAVLGVSSITPAFPRMAETLGISTARIGLLISFFSLPGIILTPIFGILADRIGRKPILVPSLFLFSIAGGACYFAQTFPGLLALRFFQGVGAASLGSLNATLIGDLFEGKRRAIAMGYNAGVLSAGTASYPAIGGAMAMFGWHYPFLLPLLAFPVGIAVIFRLKNPEPGGGMSMGNYLKGAFATFRRKEVIGLFSAALVTFIILFGSYLTYFPILMSERFSATPLLIGILMSSMSVVTIFSSTRIGWLIHHFRGRTLIITAYIHYAAALLLIPLMPSPSWLIVPVIIAGLGHGINLPVIMTLLTGMAPLEYRGAFMSVNGMVIRIGQTIGPVLMGMVAIVMGTDGVFVTGAILALSALVVIFLTIPKSME
ncbi:MAG TPA: MFS transporter [Thermoanaerobaculia bacterium]|nr:MFS transporter [Thermoanaerobaculia bacterium]